MTLAAQLQSQPAGPPGGVAIVYSPLGADAQTPAPAKSKTAPVAQTAVSVSGKQSAAQKQLATAAKGANAAVFSSFFKPKGPSIDVPPLLRNLLETRAQGTQPVGEDLAPVETAGALPRQVVPAVVAPPPPRAPAAAAQRVPPASPAHAGEKRKREATADGTVLEGELRQ